jgi:hypothetical protein
MRSTQAGRAHPVVVPRRGTDRTLASAIGLNLRTIWEDWGLDLVRLREKAAAAGLVVSAIVRGGGVMSRRTA